ncbi:MAG: hypothetical protein WC767_00460 [Candidatus Paceibacterota bacterium]
MRMRNKIAQLLFVVGVFIFSVPVVFAQPAAAPASSPDPEALLDGEQYCSVGRDRIAVALDPQKAEMFSGSSYVFSGEIANKLDIPLFDSSVIIQIRKAAGPAGAGYESTRDVIGRFVAADGINIGSGSIEPFQFSWEVPHGIASSAYRVEAFLVSGGKFAIAGSESASRPAADTLISVRGDAEGVSYLDDASILVSGVRLSDFDTATTTASSATISVDILNTHKKARTALLEYRVYKSAVINDGDLEYSGSKSIKLEPGAKQNARFELRKGDGAVRSVVMELKDGGKSSIASFKAVNPKGMLSQPVFLGLDSYPIKEGKMVKVLGCVSVSDPLASVNLAFTDNNGTKLADLGSITGRSGEFSFSKDLTPTMGIDSALTLTMSVLDAKGVMLSNAGVEYACDNGGCAGKASIPIRSLIVVLLLLAAAMGIAAYGSKRKNISRI